MTDACLSTFRVIAFFIAGIQLADLCAHPLARKVLKPDAENRAYAVIESKFYRNGKVFGLKEFPK